ncbi:uncharacterized protein DUF2620 [Thermosporothrix hazakensis]|jgi:hypothetical protein|uniref:Uncharacterized protein DUF2620 n=2 Tax=Thermosporothrix TaxID=768650 RepID=A0A326U0U0_THEHA|nr:DUF2620 family protein [Thermosporothrix hazakensis]PZW22957.1 uncharacterized protein DUF2620 [Thermosporothrix hazakensis]BBH90049.1 hypothetical protein KTC_48000 [Thermosporothrix sp. COM3]GCE48270.1 hypothetical protein KTH_31390 [Thermosporothrix hazakensis]
MLTIYVGGVGKVDVKRLLEQRRSPDLKIIASSDLEAGPAMKRNKDAYYIGTCHTGAGASLGAMLAFMGRQKCHTFGRQSKLTTKDVHSLLDSGVRAFGLSIDQINAIVPVLVDGLQSYKEKGGAS